MKVSTVFPLFVCLTIALPATVMGQYTVRPRSVSIGAEVGAGQEAAGSTTGLGLAAVTYLGGESLFMSSDAEDWGALSQNLSLRSADRVWTQDDGKAEIRFPLGATAWVNYQSELDITRLERSSNGDIIQLGLVTGEAAFDVKGFARGGSVFQVDIPNVSIRATRPARFRVNTLPDGTAQIGVISGAIVLETPDGLTDVSGGRMAQIQTDQSVVMDFLPENDEWDDWVRSRSQIYDRPAASARYLPADLSSYAHEFDTSGRWVTDRTYGSVWVPRVESGWSPYSNGRWVWQAGDYVWLSFDPWYAPFHYGRWAWRAAMGWYWIVPQLRASWSPGYVSWSVGANEVSWVPLGRNEVYYGYGNYGPNSVNVRNRTTINVTNTVYVNSKVINGVVAVRKDNFLLGRIAHERIAAPLNVFQGRESGGIRVIGRAPVQELRPLRETRQPRPEVVIQREKLPPVRVETESRAIKVRVIAPTKVKSAFKPGLVPVPLKNIRREQEQWKPAPQPRTLKNVLAPPAGQTQKGTSVIHGRPAAADVQVHEARPPAGKIRFKRVLERQGQQVNPPPVQPDRQPQEDQKQNRDKKDDGERVKGRQ